MKAGIPIKKSCRIHEKCCCMLTIVFFWQEYPAYKPIYPGFQINQKLIHNSSQITYITLSKNDNFSGNKIDREDREIPTEVGEEFSQRHGMYFLETSAKASDNVERLFTEIAQDLLQVIM